MKVKDLIVFWQNTLKKKGGREYVRHRVLENIAVTLLNSNN